jgi:ComF family protein
LVDPINGPQCPVCGQPHPPTAPTWPLCAACLEQLPPIDGARAVAFHVGPMRRAVIALKFHGRQELSGPLGEMLHQRFLNEFARPHRLDFDHVDAIVPAALHPERRRWRGYDQSVLLATELARHAGKPLWQDVLERVKHTRPLVTMSPQDRAKEMRGAFRAQKAWKLKGANLLLVDDVCTTGATLSAAARALKQGGAARVYGLTVTHAAPGWHPGHAESLQSDDPNHTRG